MSMFSSRPINLASDYKNPHNEKRKRVGKTAKDARNGNAQRNASRKAARAAWQQDKSANNSSFPV